jgi:hypothetical protein
LYARTRSMNLVILFSLLFPFLIFLWVYINKEARILTFRAIVFNKFNESLFVIVCPKPGFFHFH